MARELPRRSGAAGRLAMELRSVWPRRCGCSHVLLVLAILLVVLAVSPRFLDQFTSVKWYALEAVAAAWLLAERLLCASRGLPAFVRRTWAGWTGLSALVVLGSLRQGLGWATAPLVARASFLTLALASCCYFRRTGLRLGRLRVSVAVTAIVVIGLGLAQMAGVNPMRWLSAGDPRSATFGNVNMAAQFVGLALVVILSRPSGAGETLGRRLSMGVLGAGGFGYIVLAGTRSVALALVAAFVVLALLRRSMESLARAGVALAVAVVVLLPLAPPDSMPRGSVARASKAMSARWRLAVWSDTLDLIRDHPLGVGAGNFEHAFIPYALAGHSRPGAKLVFRSPHNDYLRLLAEEGVAGGVILLTLLLLLVRELNRSRGFGAWRSDVGALLASCGAFLAVEAFFQFPFELPFPALLAAVLLGLAFAAVEAPPQPEPPGERVPSRSWPLNLASVALAIAIVAGLVRLATAEILSVTGRDDPTALERACSLDPRRVEACVHAAWLRSRAGDHPSAQRLLAGVLGRSPDYFPAIKLLAEDLVAAGDREGGCRYARAYDALFGHDVSPRSLASGACADAAPAGGRIP